MVAHETYGCNGLLYGSAACFISLGRNPRVLITTDRSYRLSNSLASLGQRKTVDT